jgi:hypothetical protein
MGADQLVTGCGEVVAAATLTPAALGMCGMFGGMAEELVIATMSLPPAGAEPLSAMPQPPLA